MAGEAGSGIKVAEQQEAPPPEKKLEEMLEDGQEGQ